MKINHLFLAGTLFLATASFAQKDELKALKKLYAKDALKTEEYTEYKNLVQKLEGLATEESDKVYLKFYKAMVPMMEMSTWDKNMSPVAMQTQMAKPLFFVPFHQKTRLHYTPKAKFPLNKIGR